MNKSSILGNALGQVGDLGKQVGQQIADTPKDLAKAAAKQVAQVEIGENQKSSESRASRAHSASSGQEGSSDAARAEEKKFVEGLYGPTQSQGKHPSESVLPPEQQKMADEQKKAQLLKQLHDQTYYQPLIHPAKQEEEHVTDKIEREKKEEIYEQEIKKSEKPPELAVDRAANKTEKYPGASG